MSGIPYIIVLCACIVLIVLIIWRRRLVAGMQGDLILVGETAREASQVLIGNGQTIGTRAEQDDYFASKTTAAGTLAVLADGISGLANGRMASTLAVTTFLREYDEVQNYQQIPDYMEEAAYASNREIVQQLKGNHGGTTLAAVVINGHHLYWGAVGDSIISVFRNNSFIPVNSMHTLGAVLQQKVLAGEMTREQADSSPQRKQLVNYLGYEAFDSMEIGDYPFVLRPGDKVLLCSDGIHDALTEVELEAILTSTDDPQDAADQIIDSIEQKNLKHQDNATVIIMQQG
ncbi:PP2C family protein-serine/threonine phosphatase [Paenibacillus bovis]|uniref:Serine/threonine protein phosphatase n=1 Tax=Paenibacillus bovis TaxID=1616788 RepID=A0A172ZIY0_9BACL|nr:PP2C family serine/threonine-protein phosphatase [Paenibacillus bovis]ANF97591.1 serine/threonine protein phosphatase [Paenibacillus bovis]